MNKSITVFGVIVLLAACVGSQANEKVKPKSFTDVTASYDLTGGLEDCKVYKQNSGGEMVVIRCLMSDVTTENEVKRTRTAGKGVYSRTTEVYQSNTQTGAKGFFDENERRNAAVKRDEILEQIEKLQTQADALNRKAESE